LRLFLALPGFYLIWINANKFVIIAVFTVVFLTDLLDGYLARRLNQFSEFGKLLDPVVDKIIVATGLSMLLISPHYYLPIWIVAVVVGKDVLLLLGGSLVLGKRAKAIPANIWGKIAALLVIIAAACVLLGIPNPYITILFIVVTLGQLAAFVSYVIGAIGILRNDEAKTV